MRAARLAEAAENGNGQSEGEGYPRRFEDAPDPVSVSHQSRTFHERYGQKPFKCGLGENYRFRLTIERLAAQASTSCSRLLLSTDYTLDERWLILAGTYSTICGIKLQGRKEIY